MIYVYAITDACAQTPPDVPGVEGLPVLVRRSTGVSVIFSEVPHPDVEPSAQTLWQHEAVVEAVMREGDAVLPIRFGMTIHGEAALDEIVARHRHALEHGLTRVRGCVEMGLRVTPRQAQPAAASPAAAAAAHSTSAAAGNRSGREYMFARLEDERRRRASQSRADALRELIDGALSPLSREHTHRLLPAPTVLLTAAYLVPRERVESFASGARALSSECSEARVTCTGPWAPYHFVPALASPRAAEVAHG